MSDSQSNTKKLILLGVLTFAAAGVWYWMGQSDREIASDTTEALQDVSYRLKCVACDQTFVMTAANYMRGMTPEGVRCVHCGKLKAWRVADASEVDPAEFQEQLASIGSVADAMEAARAVQDELDTINRQLADLGEDADDAAATELRKKQAYLQAKSSAIYSRWAELESGSNP